MTGIEDLMRRFEALPAASQGRWSIDTLVPGRAFLTRDPALRNAIFITGAHESFGTYPKCRAIQHATGIVPVPGGTPFEALVLSSPGLGYGNRAIAHVAYELARRLEADPRMPNGDLVADVAWILELLASQEPIMPPDQQKGLIGELLLLRKLLVAAAQTGIPAREALARWFGHDKTKRDFAARGVAIEVKATALSTRRHHIASLDQLERHGDERVYLFSVGVRLDPTAPRKLPHAVAEVREMLTAGGAADEDAQAKFDAALAAYGYDPAQAPLYSAAPGLLNFHLPPKMYRVDDLDRLLITSFKGDALPRMVSGVSYFLDVTAPELPPAEEARILLDLLRAPAASG